MAAETVSPPIVRRAGMRRSAKQRVHVDCLSTVSVEK
jgi:hypothetical protein